MADHFLQMHVLQERGVLFTDLDPLVDHLVQHLCLLAGLMAHAHGVVHGDDGHHTGHCKNGRVNALTPCRGNDHCADGGAVGAGHTAVAPHAFQLEFAQQDEVDQGLEHLRHEPCQERHGQDAVE